jgi:hypothetical protein
MLAWRLSGRLLSSGVRPAAWGWLCLIDCYDMINVLRVAESIAGFLLWFSGEEC